MPANTHHFVPDELSNLIRSLYSSPESVPEAMESIQVLHATFTSAGDRESLNTAIGIAGEFLKTDVRSQQVLEFLVQSRDIPTRTSEHDDPSRGYGRNSTQFRIYFWR